jgi:hypothetical protein
MFGFTVDFLDELKKGFDSFLSKLPEDKKETAEFYLPSMVSELIDNGKAKVKVLTTPDKWIGVTYREDKPVVVDSIRKLVEAGAYEEGILR